MCLADSYLEPLPALITFPVLKDIAPAMEGGSDAYDPQDVMGFRLLSIAREETDTRKQRRDLKSDAPALILSVGSWEATIGQWSIRTVEREYCRLVQGRLRVSDRRGRRWEFDSRSAFLLLRGFEGAVEIVEPVRVIYLVFSLPDGCALDWCMAGEGRTALGHKTADCR